MKYIDADKLIAEIEKMREINKKAFMAEHITADVFHGRAQAINRLFEFITSPQQEQPHKSFCEENCKGYKDTGGKCFFDFNCSAKKAQEQPKMDLVEFVKAGYELGFSAGLNAKKEK